MSRSPIGLPFPGKPSIFWAVPQLVLLYDIDSQYQGLAQLGYNIELVVKSLGANFNAKLVFAMHR
jgi:hypothetical protein